MPFFLLLFSLLLTNTMHPANKKFIDTFISPSTKHPFSYNLAVKLIPSTKPNSDYMICCHGSGANNQIADSVKSYGATSDNLVSFNFPDHDNSGIAGDPKKISFGSIGELLPLIYILKNLVINGELTKINLYGFSAGAGVIINTLTVLSNNQYTTELASIGVDQKNIQKIIAAIQNGIVILDAPLKSIEEIIAFRGNNPRSLAAVAQNYARNNMRPIDAIQRFKNLKLNILVYFELPDEIVSNRDDAVFGNLLKKHNLGTTRIVTGSSGGHCAPHKALWHAYKNFITEK